jgi:hypothetical protein
VVENPALGTYRYTLNGRGRDIWGRHDEFYFLGFYPLVNISGCSVQSRVIRMDPTHAWAKAGVMMREKMTPHSRYAAVFVTPGNGVAFQWRETEDGPSASVRETGLSAPIQVKLERVGTGAFKAWYYRNGVWEDVNDSTGAPHFQDIPDMNDSVHVGLAVTSHNADAICSADFNDVGVSPAFPAWGFIGNVGLNDAEQMYVALKDGTGHVSVVNNPDANAATATTWQEWNIELTEFTSLDFSSVKKVYVGFGDRDSHPAAGGKGIVYIDDIRVCPPRCVPSKARLLADIAEPYDCIVDEKDIGVLVNDWLLRDEFIMSVAPSSPISQYLFDGNFLDSVGTNHGTPNGDASIITDFDRGQVLSLDGNGDFVNLGNPTDPCTLDFGTGNWSVCAWVKTTMSGTGDENHGSIIGKGGDNTGGHRYALAVGEVDEGMLTITTDDNVNKRQANSDVPINDGDWHHVVGLRDVNSLRVYIDGITDPGWVNDNLPPGYDLSGTHQHNAYIGTITDNRDATTYKYFRGSVDDAHIYDYALSPGEIAYLATNGGAGIHIPIASPADLYQGEPQGQQWINFRDYSVIAGSWLEKVLWP